jgi:hypothetical protein
MNIEQNSNKSEKALRIGSVGDSVAFYTHHIKSDPFYTGRGKIVEVIKYDGETKYGYIIKPDAKFTKAETIFRAHNEIVF